MKILIEDFEYDSLEIKEFLKTIDSHYNKGIIPFVGYLYSKSLDDCVFFLPKVILDTNGEVLGKYAPIDLWDFGKLSVDEIFLDFLYEFSIYTYQAVNIYNSRNNDNKIVRKQTISNPDGSSKEIQASYLDKILALIKFAHDNKNFLLFKMQTINSGKGRVNWPKTISHQQPILKKGKTPIYLNPIAKNKEVDYEEELLVIYFSILRYIRDKYNFKVDINLNYNLIPETMFRAYIDGEGIKRLREIRYKYFSDRTLKIWWLCMAFFEGREKKVNSSNPFEDYLIASDFDRIFESMVDELIGTPLPKHIKKEQKDGKEIDHLFLYKSLIAPNSDTYFIADSKYYKIGHRPEGTSLFKQYTYARNLMQERLHHKEKEEIYDLWRDDKTEGYNIIPNFFLSAYIHQDDKGFNYDKPGIIYQKDQDQFECHFRNRLFDRETLLLSQYDINFLYVVKHYANNAYKDVFRNEVHHRFRKDILNRLNTEYSFYILELKNKPEQGKEQLALKESLDPIFRLVNGKVFCPKKDPSYTNLILALEKKEEFIKENQEVKDALKKDFFFDEEGFTLGASIEEFLTKKKTAE